MSKKLILTSTPASSTSQAKATTGQKTETEKRTGLRFVTKGGMYSKDNSWQVSFAYFRTKDGQPPR